MDALTERERRSSGPKLMRRGTPETLAPFRNERRTSRAVPLRRKCISFSFVEAEGLKRIDRRARALNFQVVWPIFAKTAFGMYAYALINSWRDGARRPFILPAMTDGNQFGTDSFPLWCMDWGAGDPDTEGNFGVIDVADYSRFCNFMCLTPCFVSHMKVLL